MARTNPKEPSALRSLSRRGEGRAAWLGPAARQAALRLGDDILRAGMLPRTTMDWSRARPIDVGASDRSLTPSEARLGARARVEGALRAVGPELSGLLLDVCAFDKGLEMIERERGWPVRSGKVAVKTALDALARHYGYADAAVGIGGRARTWAADDAKPRPISASAAPPDDA